MGERQGAAEGGSGYGIGQGGAVGLQATSGSGYGVAAQGGRAPLYLKPGAASGAPTGGEHQQGELYVDSQAALFFCQQSGTPGVWKQLA